MKLSEQAVHTCNKLFSKLLGFFTLFALSSYAHACIGEYGIFNWPIFFAALLAVTLFVSLVISCSWIILNKFLHNKDIDRLLLASTVVVSIVIGICSIFIIPEYVRKLNEFGSDLPRLTLIIINQRYLLWLPLVGTVIFTVLLKNNSNKTLFYSVLLLPISATLILILLALYLPFFTLSMAC
jgi:hypothetical protein